MTMSDTVLVTVLGMVPQRTTYTLDGRSLAAPLAPIAVARLRGDIAQVVALCTEEAREGSLPVLQEGVAPTRVESARITIGRTQEEIQGFLDTLVSVLRDRRIVLDLTHGPRHLAMLAFAASLYAATIAGTEVVAVYYGLLAGETSTIVDLRPLLELSRLGFGADALARAGDARPLAELVRRSGGKGPEMLSKNLEALSSALASGLPLELGKAAHRFRTDGAFERWMGERRIPLRDDLRRLIDDALASFAFATLPEGWKSALELSTDELDRQSRIIDRLLEQRAHAPAVILLEEWAVSWVCLTEEKKTWLDRDVRAWAEGRLHALRAWEQDPELRGLLSEDQRRLGRWWGSLSELRNSLAHAGMRGEEVAPWDRKSKLGSTLRKVQQEWAWIRDRPAVSFQVPGEYGVLLVSPVGRVPGAFYTALLGAGPADRYLCVCSSETESLAREVLGRVGVSGDLRSEVLADPYGGRGEVDGLVHRVRGLLARAEQVRVNLTGGTTLMGLVVERIAEEAVRLGVQVRRFLCLDRRSREEQECDPFVPGELAWLEAP